MKMLYFSVTLMVALVGATAYLALQARDEAIKANTKMDMLTSQQRAIAAQQSAEVQLPPPAFEKPALAPAPLTPPPAPALVKLNQPPAVIAQTPAPVPAPTPASTPKDAPPASRPAGSPTPAPTPAPAPTATLTPKLAAQSSPPPAPMKPSPAKAGSAIVLEDEPVPAAGPAPLTPAQRLVKSAPSIGKVKEFVPDQGFVVLSSGTKQGIAAGLKFDIRRDSSIIGRIKITNADETESVADVDLKSVPSGVTIRDGDEIIGVVLQH